MVKRKKLKFIAIILELVLLFQYISLLVPLTQVEAATLTATDSNGITWLYTLNDNNEATITRYSSGTIGETLEIPAELNGCTVIGVTGTYYSYSYRGYSVIYYDYISQNIKTIKLPDSLKNIGEYAFCNLTNLNKIIYYNSENEEVEGNLEYIGYGAFRNCTSLTSITIPNSVTSMGNGVFFECTSLTNVKMPNNIDYISMNTFYGCSSLIGIDIPDDVTYIDNNAFWGCSSLTNVIIPDGVESIGWGAFANCSNLEKIEISDNVTSIDNNAFMNCNKLTIYGSGNEDSEAYQFAEQNNIKYIGNIEIKCNDINFYNKLKEQIPNEYIKIEKQEEQLIYINYKEVEKIEELDLSNANISDITGIQNLTNLTKLNLNGNRISDVSLLDNLEITDLDLRNQEITKEIWGDITLLPNILQNAVEDKYGKGSLVVTDNAKIEDNNIKMESKNISSNEKIQVTVNGGIMDGTVCTFKIAENVVVEYEIDIDELELRAYKDTIELTDVTLYYSIDNSEFSKYTGKITMAEGEHKLIVKFFDQELINQNISVNIDTLAIRKNGKIYIYDTSNYEKKYSLTGEEFIEYKEAIENEQAKTIFVKIGENNAKEIEIKDIDGEYEILDVQTNSDVIFEDELDEYIRTHRNKAIRKDGIIKIRNMENVSQTVYYSFDNTENFDDKVWYEYNKDDGIKNIEADTIYIRINYYYRNEDYTYKIANYNKLSEILGIYNKDESSYIFGQVRTNSVENNDDRLLIVNDENKIEQLLSNEKVLDVTGIAGDVYILKDDGKVYKIGNSYDDLQLIDGGVNFKQIEGIYALDNDNNIWKCKYDYENNKYLYEKCNYTIEDKIEKMSLALINGNYCPYILCENGKVKSIKEDGTIEEISNGVIDIAINESNIYMLKYDTVMYNDIKIDISKIIENGEIPLKINKQGSILTNKGNYYEINATYQYSGGPIESLAYPEEPNKIEIAKLGDYTYQDNSERVYYLQNNFEIERKVDNISITKDESNLIQGKVNIKIQVPENTYTIAMPNGETSKESNLVYEVTEDGVYTFEFIDSNGYSVIRVVHVTNIQSRKETKVPEVEVLNGKIKLKSDDEIEYSLDKENWNQYTDEIAYKGTIYTRIKSDKYECSILKITIDENGELNVENTEKREIQGEILNGSVGKTQYEDNIKVIEYEKEVEEKSSDNKNESKNFFEYISEIADNIIYSFSSTDGEYAGCHFTDEVTEITYKDINNDTVSVKNQDISINNISENMDFIDYAVIAKEYTFISKEDTTEEKEQEKVANGEIYEAKYETDDNYGNNGWKETKIKYVYLDNQGNLTSNIDIINKTKEIIGENKKYTKIVGDGTTFYILTEEGEVYLATQDDNGTYSYLANKLNLGYDTALIDYNSGKSVDVIFKLQLKDIVNIYDSCTAQTKDGKIVSLLKDDEESTSVVQELQKQTDKYLVASHLGLKDGKLYNFDSINEGVEVTAGKIVKTQDTGLGIYSESKKTIELLNEEEKNGSIIGTSLAEDESYIDVEPINEQLPEFIDIVEYRESYFTRLSYKVLKYPSDGEAYMETIDYSNSDDFAKCYALTAEGELWAYIGDYVVDTGINLDYFGPTLNYNLDNTNWTNKDVSLDITANTTNQIQDVKITKGEEIIAQINNSNKQESGENTIKIQTNGQYNVEIKDGKSRTYISTLSVNNIDKMQPIISSTGIIEDGVVTIEAYDKEDETGNNAMSGIAKVEIAYEEPTDETQWTEISGGVNEQGRTIIKIQDAEENKVVYIRAVDNAQNISEIKKIKFTKTPEQTPEQTPEDTPDPDQTPIEKYTVTFVDYDGKVLSKQTVEKGASAIPPKNPTRADYTFKGWDKDYKNVQEDLTITAQYTKNLENIATSILPKTGRDWAIIIVIMLIVAIISSVVAYRKWHS